MPNFREVLTGLSFHTITLSPVLIKDLLGAKLRTDLRSTSITKRVSHFPELNWCYYSACKGKGLLNTMKKKSKSIWGTMIVIIG